MKSIKYMFTVTGLVLTVYAFGPFVLGPVTTHIDRLGSALTEPAVCGIPPGQLAFRDANAMALQPPETGNRWLSRFDAETFTTSAVAVQPAAVRDQPIVQLASTGGTAYGAAEYSVVDGVTRPQGDYPRFRYGPPRGPSLSGKGDVVSEKICLNPTTKRICRRAFEQYPDAVWSYTHFSETERKFAEAKARRFAKQQDGFVQHEGVSYVVYRPIQHCSYEITGCQVLQ